MARTSRKNKNPKTILRQNRIIQHREQRNTKHVTTENENYCFVRNRNDTTTRKDRICKCRLGIVWSIPILIWGIYQYSLILPLSSSSTTTTTINTSFLRNNDRKETLILDRPPMLRDHDAATVDLVSHNGSHHPTNATTMETFHTINDAIQRNNSVATRYNNTIGHKDDNVDNNHSNHQQKNDLSFVSSSSSSLLLEQAYQRLQFSSLQQQQQQQQKEEESSSSMSACILIKDENHRLSEWIAYHYYALPLRYLVVMMDPTSTQSPYEILQRWSPLIHISIWNNDTIIGHRHRGGAVTNPSNPNHQNHKLLEHSHLNRQQLFIKKCFSYLKYTLNQTWTTAIDVDEYIRFNPKLMLDAHERFQQVGHVLKLIQDSFRTAIPTTTSTTTTTTTTTTDSNSFHPNQSDGFNNNSTNDYYRKYIRHDDAVCIVVPRYGFGSKEIRSSNEDKDNRDWSKETKADTTTTITTTTTTSSAIDGGGGGSSTIPDFINTTNFETLRFRYRANAYAHKVNGQPKSIYNVQYIPKDDEYDNNNDSRGRRHQKQKQQWGGIHFVVNPTCRLHSRWNDNLLVINHYKGSLETYLSRFDVRRTRKKFEEYQQDANQEYDDFILSWISLFVEHVGRPLAEHLLQDIGRLDN